MKLDLISRQVQFDTSTPISHAMFAIVSAMAQLERAKGRGKKLRLPRVVVDVEVVHDLRLEGLSLRAITPRLRCSRSTFGAAAELRAPH